MESLPICSEVSSGTAPLFTSNRNEELLDELELISYVLSHDLQAPLRIMQGCCQDLQNHPAFVADTTLKNTLQTLTEEAARAKLLTQSIVDYIRLDTFVTASVPLDANEILASALTALEAEIKATGAIITYDALPHIMGHRGRLTRLFIHLLDNALKFCKAAPPNVHISARAVKEDWEFCVKDNGIGINPEHHTIIFTLFQRLHTGEAYPGYGVGLALARKTVEVHGGRMWVESQPETGSRFYFTLPQTETQ